MIICCFKFLIIIELLPFKNYLFCLTEAKVKINRTGQTFLTKYFCPLPKSLFGVAPLLRSEDCFPFVAARFPVQESSGNRRLFCSTCCLKEMVFYFTTEAQEKKIKNTPALNNPLLLQPDI